MPRLGTHPFIPHHRRLVPFQGVKLRIENLLLRGDGQVTQGRLLEETSLVQGAPPVDNSGNGGGGSVSSGGGGGAGTGPSGSSGTPNGAHHEAGLGPLGAVQRADVQSERLPLFCAFNATDHPHPTPERSRGAVFLDTAPPLLRQQASQATRTRRDIGQILFNPQTPTFTVVKLKGRPTGNEPTLLARLLVSSPEDERKSSPGVP